MGDLPQELKVNFDPSTMDPNLLQEMLHKAQDSTLGQQVLQYFGRAFPKNELIQMHRKNRKATMDRSNYSLSIQNSFIQHQKKPQLELEDVSEYVLISIRNLQVGSTHKKRVLKGKIIELPCVMEGIHTIIEDLNGDILQVSIYNVKFRSFKEADELFPLGYELQVYDPFMKAFTNGGIGVRVDNPKEIYVGPPKANQIDKEYHSEANRLFKEKEYAEAALLYSRVLQTQAEAAKVLGNIAACLIKMGQTTASLGYACCAVRVDDTYTKGWFRIRTVLEQQNKNEELVHIQLFAPEDVLVSAFKEVPRIQKKNKNKQILPMRSFLTSNIRQLGWNQFELKEGSFEDLKKQGNTLFRSEQFNQALDFYFSALRLDKEKISLLFRNRAACKLQQSEFIEALIDSSSSLLLQYDGNDKAVYRRAQALREMDETQQAIEALSEDLNLLKNSASLQSFHEQLKTLDGLSLPSVPKNEIGTSKNTAEYEIQEGRKKEVASGESLAAFEQLFKLLLPEKRQKAEDLFYDKRVPPFYQEYFEGGHLPQQCDKALSESWLMQVYQDSRRITKKLESLKMVKEYAKDDEMSKFEMQDIAKRLGSVDQQRIKWWCEAEMGDVSFLPRSGSYCKDILHSFSNVWATPMDLTQGTIHVAVGYVDLGQLLNASFHEEDNPAPLKFVGYEQSVYCTAKTLVIAKMLKDSIESDTILQVWYSSGWSSKTLDEFRKVVSKLLQQELGDKEVEDLLKYWLVASRVPLLKSQRLWLKFHNDHNSMVGNAIKEQDRMELCSYSLTGRLLQCDVGSVVMFANPPKFPHLTLHETVLWQIKEIEVLQNYEQYGSVLGVFIGLTTNRIDALGEKIKSNRIVIDLRRKTVTPNDTKTLKEIQALSPYTMSWSNLVDYYGPERFHKMAKACSAKEDTIHFVHSMNWIQETKGACILDYPFEYQCFLYEKICSELMVPMRILFKDVFLSPPVDNPYNIVDGFLTMKYSKNWGQAFFKVGNIPNKSVAYNFSYPYSLFCRAQGNFYFCYTYDASVNFKMKKVEGIGQHDQEFLKTIFG